MGEVDQDSVGEAHCAALGLERALLAERLIECVNAHRGCPDDSCERGHACFELFLRVRGSFLLRNVLEFRTRGNYGHELVPLVALARCAVGMGAKPRRDQYATSDEPDQFERAQGVAPTAQGAAVL